MAPRRPVEPAPKPPAAKRNSDADANRLADEIARFEEEQAKLSEELSKPDFYATHPDPTGLLARYAEIKKQVSELYRRLDRELDPQSQPGQGDTIASVVDDRPR